jgi:CDP-paratose 2-epimerase
MTSREQDGSTAGGSAGMAGGWDAPLLKLVRGGGADRPVLITGGAGFVGCNLADRLLSRGVPVLVFDNLAREGVEANLSWLRERQHRDLRIEIGDVRDAAAVAGAVARSRSVFHFAAQVAVTTSLGSPTEDFDVNARGTLNVLEAVRRQEAPPPLVFTSTNKVYGGLADVALRTMGRRYEPVDPALRAHGVGESRPLDFHSPYGCSKGAADQYVIDYARTFGIEAVVFRMSCIYGPLQCGNEDQGWVAHFLKRALAGESITLFGDGLQVRDVLYIDDLLDAFELAHADVRRLSGRAFNIGGGPGHAVSLLEVVDRIGELRGERPAVEFSDWRPGDQRYYVSDIRAFEAATGWRPRVEPVEGMARLLEWLERRSGARRSAVRRRAARELV